MNKTPCKQSLIYWFVVGAMWCTPQSDILAQTLPLVRDLKGNGPSSKIALQSILDIQALSNGSVLVNDGVGRLLLMLDSTLALKFVLLDSVTSSGASYGPTPSPLIRYLSDSILFVDGISKTLLVIDPTGRIAHTMSAPKALDLSYIAAAPSAIDAKGNLVYHGIAYSNYVMSHADTAKHVPPPDSAPLLRASFEMRTVDTVARVHDAATKLRYESVSSAIRQMNWVINPVATPDEWAMMSDHDGHAGRSHQTTA